MHAHRIDVLDGADDDAVVRRVADHFHFIFLPAEQALVDQDLTDWRCVDARADDGFEFFPVIGNAAAGATQGEGGANDGRQADLVDGAHGFKIAGIAVVTDDPAVLVVNCRGGGDGRARVFQADDVHRSPELFAVFSLFDDIGAGADHFHAVFFQNTHLFQIECAVQRGLATHRRQKRVRAFLLDDLGHQLGSDRLDVGRVSQVRVGHDRRRVRVDQDDAIPFLAQRLAGLGARIIEFTCLTDDNRTGTNNQDGRDICAFWHLGSQLAAAFPDSGLAIRSGSDMRV